AEAEGRRLPSTGLSGRRQADGPQALQHRRRAPTLAVAGEELAACRVQLTFQSEGQAPPHVGDSSEARPDITVAVDEGQRRGVRVAGRDAHAEGSPELRDLVSGAGREGPVRTYPGAVLGQHGRRIRGRVGGDL